MHHKPRPYLLCLYRSRSHQGESLLQDFALWLFPVSKPKCMANNNISPGTSMHIIIHCMQSLQEEGPLEEVDKHFLPMRSASFLSIHAPVGLCPKMLLVLPSRTSAATMCGGSSSSNAVAYLQEVCCAESGGTCKGDSCFQIHLLLCEGICISFLACLSNLTSNADHLRNSHKLQLWDLHIDYLCKASNFMCHATNSLFKGLLRVIPLTIK